MNCLQRDRCAALQRRMHTPCSVLRVVYAQQQPLALLQPRRSVATPTAASLHSGAATSPHRCSISSICTNRSLLQHTAVTVGRRRCRRQHALPPLAMINVDFASPSLVLGITLIGCGIALLQVRNMQREVSRDADIVVAAMISIVGSTLIFQGWRLDPLLLLCQALTTSVAFWYGLETFKLRAQMTEEEDADIASQLPPPEGYSNSSQMDDPYTAATRSGYLPPAADRQVPPWGMQQQQQQQPGIGAAGSSRWGLPPAADQSMYQDYFNQAAPQADSAYAGYENQYMGSNGAGQLPPMQQQPQQPYGVPADVAGQAAGYGSSGYGSSSMYGQQLPQQPQQFNLPAGPAYQEGWYTGAAAGPLQAPYGAVPGAGGVAGVDASAGVGQFGPSGSLGLLQDGAGALGPAAGGYAADGSGIPLPLPPAAGAEQQQGVQQRQQQQQQGSRLGPGAYERVDDWE